MAVGSWNGSETHLVSTPCLHALSDTLRPRTLSLRFVESERWGGCAVSQTGVQGILNFVASFVGNFVAFVESHRESSREDAKARRMGTANGR